MLFNRFNRTIIPLPRFKRFIFSVSLTFLIFYYIYVLFTIMFSSYIGNSASDLPLTIHCNAGRLGNQMGTYATLYGLARLNNRIPYVLPCNNRRLEKYFDISAKTTGYYTYRHECKINEYLREEDHSLPRNCNKLAGFLYPFSYTFYDKFQDEIRREFTFKSHIRNYARDVLNKAKRIHNGTVFVGIHIRRGKDYDFILDKYHWKKMDLQYLVDAMNYFKKYKSVVFIVVSDNQRWCDRNLRKFSDVYITPQHPIAGYDMAVLAQCNHTIITYGTFGYWSAYLAGGETVYFANHLTSDSKQFITDRWSYNMTYLPNWVGIGPGFRITG